MASGDVLQKYAASSALTWTLASLASDTSLIAGRCSSTVDNTGTPYQDYHVGGKITVGTTPTTATTIEIWAVAISNDTPLWPTSSVGVFGSGDAAVTVYSRGSLFGYGRLLVSLQVDSATSNRPYEFSGLSIAAAYGGRVPEKFCLWAVHNTAVNLNSTGGNHVVSVTPVYSFVTP